MSSHEFAISGARLRFDSRSGLEYPAFQSSSFVRDDAAELWARRSRTKAASGRYPAFGPRVKIADRSDFAVCLAAVSGLAVAAALSFIGLFAGPVPIFGFGIVAFLVGFAAASRRGR